MLQIASNRFKSLHLMSEICRPNRTPNRLMSDYVIILIGMISYVWLYMETTICNSPISTMFVYKIIYLTPNAPNRFKIGLPNSNASYRTPNRKIRMISYVWSHLETTICNSPISTMFV